MIQEASVLSTQSGQRTYQFTVFFYQDFLGFRFLGYPSNFQVNKVFSILAKYMTVLCASISGF